MVDRKGFEINDGRQMNDNELNQYFKKLVRAPNGVSHVSHIADYEGYPQRILKIARLYLGDWVIKYAKITGSVAQNLKCESFKSKGDADVMFLSKFPEINSENKEYSIISGSEIGFCRIKYNSKASWAGNHTPYPMVRDETDDVTVVKASSLRQLELGWWPLELQPAMLVLDFLGKRTYMFSKFEQPENGAAISISWSSSYSTLGTFDSPGIRFYKIFTQSYMKNIMPLLEVELRGDIEKFFKIFMDVLQVTVHYIESDVHMVTIDRNTDYLYDIGIFYYAMQYCAKQLRTRRVCISKGNLSWLQSKCEELIESTRRETELVLDIKEEIRHKKTGSVDLVPAIDCRGFPDEAMPWKQRVQGKSWPPQRIVEQVIEAGFQLVPKAPKSNISSMTCDTSFRYSFNDAENLLCLSLSDQHREVFRIVKMFYYEKLQREPKLLETYHLKTLLFWFLEEQTGDESACIGDDNKLAELCLAVLRRLAGALREHHLSHYFIEEINLFHYLNNDELNELAMVVDDITNDPIGNTGPVIESIIEFYNKKITQPTIQYDDFDTGVFFEQADRFFKTVSSEPNVPNNTEDDDDNDDGKRCTNHKDTNINDRNNDSTVANDDEALPRILRFLSDLMLARVMEEQLRAQNLDGHQLKRLRLSPFLSFILTMLPVTRDVITATSVPVLGCSQEKYFKKIAFYRMLLRIGFFLYNLNCIAMLLRMVTVSSRVFKFLKLDRLGRLLYGVRRRCEVYDGPSSQLVTFLSGCFGVIITVISCLLFLAIFWFFTFKHT
eukprot:gene6046-6748_t